MDGNKETVNYRIVTDFGEIRRLLDNKLPVAFDFETAPDDAYRDEEKAALDAHKAHVTGCSFSLAEADAFYVPFTHRAGKNVDDPEAVWAFLKDAVYENTGRVKIAHNLAFEAMFLYAKGIVVQEPCYDTIAAAQLTLKSHYEFRSLRDSGLKLLATQLFHAEMPSFTAVTDGRHFDEMDPAEWETTRYACADSDYTLRLYHKFNWWFDTYLPAHRTVVEKLESPTAVYVGMMKYNGVPVDRVMMAKRQQEAAEKIMQLRKEIDGITGGVNIGANASTNAFKLYLYHTLKLPVMKTTEKNQAAADDAAMQMLKEWCAENKPELVRLFELIQEYRKWGKIKSTYIDGYLEYVNSATGRIHPELMPLGASTGRFACRQPNLQNEPAPGDDVVGVRNFIKAPEGWRIMEADYSQVELKLAAFVSNDQTMLGAYRDGKDIHAITTSAVFGIPVEEAADKRNPQYKHRRTVAKATMFGILYGIGAQGLAANLRYATGIPYTVDECRKYIAGILDTYKGLAQWQQDIKQRTGMVGFSETEYGRRRYLPGVYSTDNRKRSSAMRMALNSPVQGLACDCLKHAMALLVRELKGIDYIKPIMTVHDSLVMEVREDKVEEAVATLKRCMEDKLLPGLPYLRADASVGERYGTMEEM